MQEFSVNLSAQSVEEKLRFIKEHALLPSTTESITNHNLRLFFSDSSNLQRNCVTYSSFANSEDAKKAIDEIRKKNKPMIWWVTSHTAPANMGELLKERGFIQFRLAALACSLSEVKKIQRDSSSTISIKKISEDDQDWKNILREGFSHSEENSSQNNTEKEPKSNQKDQYTHNYGLYDNNELVCIGSLFIKDDWVGVCNFVTKKSAQKKAFATQLAAYLAEDVLNRGYTTAVSMTVPITEQMGKKFGFKKIFDLDLYYIQ